MSDQQPPQRPLSEISHLFLSSVRDRQTQGNARPQRTPPGARQEPPAALPEASALPRDNGSSQPDYLPPHADGQAPRRNVSIDLTPEEFAHVFGGGAPQPSPEAEPEPRKSTPFTAVIGGHLNGRQFDRVKEYARHLAAQIGRVGLIELDGSEFRLMCFEPGMATPIPADIIGAECYDPRQMAEALEELNLDIDRWLLLTPNPRTPEARALLRAVDHWVLLSTCDHDGIVSSYRMLKGLAESHRPRLSLALLDAADEPEAIRVCNKLSGVCRQFLNWELKPEPPVRTAPRIAEHLVQFYRSTHDKGQLAAAPQWEIVGDFIARTNPPMPIPEPPAAIEPPPAIHQTHAPIPPARIDPPAPIAAPRPVAAEAPAPASSAAATFPALAAASDAEDVLELPGADATADAILAAVLHAPGRGLVESPIRAPMCVASKLAIGRDRSLVLLAVASRGLPELRTIGQAYRWMNENRSLIAMALPQFAIDPNQLPRLQLLVDQNDISAGVLQPMFETGHVRVQAYRKLRWGGRTGLLLEAA